MPRDKVFVVEGGEEEFGGLQIGNSEVITIVLNSGILGASLYKKVVCSAFSFYYFTGKALSTGVCQKPASGTWGSEV